LKDEEIKQAFTIELRKPPPYISRKEKKHDS